MKLFLESQVTLVRYIFLFLGSEVKVSEELQETTLKAKTSFESY